MKNLYWIPLLVMATHTVTATAQNYCRDTIDYPNPNYFYYFDTDKWITSDTMVMSWDMVETGYRDDPDSGRTRFFKYDSVLHEIHHELKTLFQLFQWTTTLDCDWIGARDEGMYYNYTPRPLKVVGIAAHVGMSACTGTGDGTGIFWGNPDSTEYLILYDARPDTFVCRRQQPMDFEGDSVRWERRRLRNTNRMCCNNLIEYYITQPFIETYFDRPILVKDSFYIGGTNYSHNSPIVILSEGHIIYDSTVTTIGYDAFRAGFNNGTDQVGVDTCKMIRTKYIWRYTTPSHGQYIQYQWYRDDVFFSTPQIYPIYEEMCPIVEGVHVEHSQSDEVSVTWNAHGSHTTWMVSYGPLGIPRDSFAVVVCLQPSLTITGLDSTAIYDICVQAQCDYRASDYDFYDADVFGNHDTTFVSEQDRHLYVCGGSIVAINSATADDGILLRPNPADRQVTVSASMPMRRVEVYDLAGRLIETCQPNGTEFLLNLEAYTSGTYLVKVTTATGTATKKLVVK